LIKKTFLLLLICTATLLSQTNIDLVGSLNQYPSIGYNDIWGYVDEQGIEYALLGTRHGTSIVRLDNPSNPQEVAFIPGPSSIWRDLKVHGNYAYAVTEGTSSGTGLQIIDLSQLPTSANLLNTVDTWFTGAHNIFIDDGYAYVIGTDGIGGMHILDLSNPVNPTRTAYYTESGYIHDVYVWNDTVVACAGSSGEYHLVDVSNKSNPQLVSQSPSLPGTYAHSGWMTEDKRYFYGTEEFNSVDITVWDLQDRTTWDLVVPSWQTPSSATVHNLFILGNYAHISYYSDGYVVLDISNPEEPYLIGEYTTSDMWGCYPYLPSGLTICSDMDDGLYIFQFTADDVPPAINHTAVTEVFDDNPVTILAQIIDNVQVTSANLRYRISGNRNREDWNLVVDPNGPNQNMYEFEIPGFPNQTEVEYYISAQDNNENVSTLPEGGSGANPPGTTPPTEFFTYTVQIPGQPVLNGVSPTGDTTITVGAVLTIEIFATDTSGFDLSYTWIKNSTLLNNTGSSIPFIALPNPAVPRTDTITVEFSNGFFMNSFTWLITIDNPSGIENENIPSLYSLMQNYPNPFNPSTQIRYSIANSEFVNLSIFNSLGEKISELVNENKPAGEYRVTFDADNLSSGIYIARITAGSFTQLIKMALLK
jgi:choice-of-anchor B domain-containing protein